MEEYKKEDSWRILPKPLNRDVIFKRLNMENRLSEKRRFTVLRVSNAAKNEGNDLKRRVRKGTCR
jgi:hypothetical protein